MDERLRILEGEKTLITKSQMSLFMLKAIFGKKGEFLTGHYFNKCTVGTTFEKVDKSDRYCTNIYSYYRWTQNMLYTSIQIQKHTHRNPQVDQKPKYIKLLKLITNKKSEALVFGWVFQWLAVLSVVSCVMSG